MRELALLLVVLPVVWLVGSGLRRGMLPAAAYGVLLYTTFLGDLARVQGVSLSVLLAAGLVSHELVRRATGRAVATAPIGVHDVLALMLMAWTLAVTASRSGDLGDARQPIVLAAIIAAGKFRPEFSARDFGQIRKACVAGGAIVALSCLVQYRTGDLTLYGLLEPSIDYEFEFIGRPQGLQGNPNAASLYLLFGYCGALVGCRLERTIEAASALVTCVLIGWALVRCESRSAVAGAMLVTALRAAWAAGLKERGALVTLAAFVPLAWALREVLVGVGEAVFDRPSVQEFGREERWSLAMNVIYGSPFTGDSSVRYDHKSVNFHNDFLQLAANFGLPAVGLFVALLAVLVLVAWRVKCAESGLGWGAWWFLVVLASVVHSMFHVQLVGGICFWMIAGLGLNNLSFSRRTGLVGARAGGARC